MMKQNTGNVIDVGKFTNWLLEMKWHLCHRGEKNQSEKQ